MYSNPMLQAQSLQNINNVLNNPMMKGLNNAIGIAKNPLLAFKNMLMQDPNYSNVMNLIKLNGGNIAQTYYNLAKEKGVDPDQFLQQIQNSVNIR